jgi:mRNA-degrading endonuclease toxin of MazEF toxin-antitoxin module
MKRGTVIWVDLSDVSPPEMGKVRPGIVVSNTEQNAVLSTVVVVPTSSLAPEIIPLRLAVGKFAGQDSFAIIPGIRQVRKSRLRNTLGVLSPVKLARLDECINTYLR